ncbi:MAG: hypothetical protein E6J88_06625 [Deltaproteobacteria bacterium]|nr:MAG: hypothetical protein E6J88_06625 [Deltaproteobacteria bacterium]
MHTRLFALAAAALAACGGSVNTTPGQSSSCSVTLSGGLTGTYDCKPAVTAWASSNNQGGFSFGVAQSGSTPSISVAVGMPGEPHTGTYTTTTSGVDSAIAINTGSGGTAQYWIEGSGSGSQTTGTFTLTFSSVSNAITASNGKVYTGDGTLTATLKNATGGGADVTLSATF